MPTFDPTTIASEPLSCGKGLVCREIDPNMSETCRNNAGQVFDCLDPRNFNTDFTEFTLQAINHGMKYLVVAESVIICLLIIILCLLAAINEKLRK